MSIPQRAAIAALAGAAVVLVLVACTAVPAPTESGEPGFDPGDATIVSGTGSAAAVLTIPEGAGSLLVRIACSDGYWTLDAGGDLGDLRSGACGGEPATLAIGLPPRGAVTVQVGEDELVVAELTFAAEPPPSDAALAADCEALGAYRSAIASAENGIRLEAIDDAGWQGYVEDAQAALDAMTPTPLVEPLLPPLAEALEEATPGELFGAAFPEAARADSVLAQLCSGNGTTIVIMSQYGG